MAVNLLVEFDGERFANGTVAAAQRDAHARGYTLVHAAQPDERLLAWIDWQFAPSWWSSEVRAGEAWYALAADGTIAGFAAFDPRGLRFPWLSGYRGRDDVGIFGPYGVAEPHRKTGLGESLLAAALGSLRARGYARSLIPAVGGDGLIAAYTARTGARVVDEFSYDARRRYRTVILASGSGSNAQAVIDQTEEGRLPLDLVGLVSNAADAFALMRARRAGIVAESVLWHRGSELRAAFDERLLAAVEAYEPDLVLLLGWMHLLAPNFVARFPEMMNIHPAFLPFDARADAVTMPDGTLVPAFRGAHGVRDTLAAGVAWGGASVHRVTAQTDRGQIVVRTPFTLEGITDEATFVRKLRPVEHAAIVSAVRRWVFESEG